MHDSFDDVAIFWDYGEVFVVHFPSHLSLSVHFTSETTENCPVPSNTSGYSVVEKIRLLAQPYGSVKSFKAYLEISDQVQKSVLLRSELQSSGVSLVDCPHNGRKDVADKMMIGGCLCPGAVERPVLRPQLWLSQSICSRMP
ncbi:hypothetical protein CVT26_006713 [Gymnopilus dilepis]|uniref:Uncharacterized protein n=1 Tax=Gymnopilus dilepis TaxID=231916 RepID=A0A409W0P0_9AGAR|nr:hypothetical protein CVT26_006713 [Gymnopilus dilepis]